MMRKLRDNTHVVLWILILAFVGTIVLDWGMGGFENLGGDGEDRVATINGTELTLADYERQVNARLQGQGDQASGQAVLQARRQGWNDLVSLTLERQLAERMGYGWSDREVSDRILYQPPAFVVQDTTFLTNGVFDTTKWHDMLRGENATGWLLQMEEQIRQSLALEKLRARLSAVAVVSDAALRHEHVLNNQTADGAYVVFPYGSFQVDSTQISEAELEAWHKSHLDDYETEERREIEYVQLQVVPSAEDTADAMDQMDYVLKQLEKGETFEDLARIYSMDESNADRGGDLGWFGRGRMVPEFEAAAFGAAPGVVAGPVKTAFGFHLLKVNGRETRDNGTGVKEEQVQAQHILIKVEPSSMTHGDLRAKAEALYEDMQTGQHDFEVLCAERQFKIQTGRPFTQKGTVPGVGRSQRAADLIFAAKAGEVIQPVYSDNGGWFVIRVKEIKPKGHESVKDRRTEIQAAVRKEKQKALALKAAQEWLNAAKPATLDSLMALPAQAQFGNLANPIRANQFIPGQVGRDLTFGNRLFTTPVGQLSLPFAGERGVYVLQPRTRVDAAQLVAELGPQLPAKRAEALQQQKSGIYGQWSGWAKEKADIADRRAAFGFDY